MKMKWLDDFLGRKPKKKYNPSKGVPSHVTRELKMKGWNKGQIRQFCVAYKMAQKATNEREVNQAIEKLYKQALGRTTASRPRTRKKA